MLIVFDLDGTLIDSARDLADSTNEVLASFGAVPLPADDVVAMVGDGARMLLARAIAAAGADAPVDEALVRFESIYQRRLARHTRPYAGIVAGIAELSVRASLAVLTNKPIAPARKLLETFDLASRFRWTVGGDGPLPRKPDPAGLEHLMAEAGAPVGLTLFVGDSPIDVATARAAGVTLCLARYGFGFRSGPAPQPGDLVVDDPRELARTIGSFLDRGSPT